MITDDNAEVLAYIFTNAQRAMIRTAIPNGEFCWPIEAIQEMWDGYFTLTTVSPI